jgi:hypothetical protein
MFKMQIISNMMEDQQAWENDAEDADAGQIT